MLEILFRGDPNYESQSYSKKPEEKTQVDNLIDIDCSMLRLRSSSTNY